MTLWTIQPRELYEQILRTGKYTFDETKEPLALDFKDAYRWMEDHMKSAGIARKNLDDPLVWAWHTYDGLCQCPPVDDWIVWSEDRKDEVILEIEVPDDQAMLSDFDAWHFVLNHFYYGDSKNDEEFDKEMAWLDSLSEEEREVKVKESWEKIFDIAKYRDDWSSNGYYVQATFYGLTKDMIRKVYAKPERFIRR